MPLPRRRNTCPVWVSEGTLTLAEPSSVGISISPPSAACVKLMGISQCRSSPSRWKTGCAFAGQADAVAFVHARRDLHRERLVLLEPARAAARGARIRDHLARAVA